MTKNQHFEEFVMVFPKSVLMNIGYFQGLSFEAQKYIQVILEEKNCKFMRRKDAEGDLNYKQLIPYVILVYKDNIFTYRRGKLTGEERLLGDHSIGIGGHIVIGDHNLFGVGYEWGLQRELEEEVEIKTKFKMRVAGLINDDTNEVGKVHFGVVHVATLDNPSVSPKEKSITQGKFWSIEELKKNINKFENWSKLCINEIENLLS